MRFASPLTAIAQKFGRYWWTLLVVGIVWIILGFVVLRFDRSPVAVISIVFGILVLLSAAGELFRAVITPGGWKLFHIVFAVLLVIGAIWVFLNPAGAFISLALVTGLYFVLIGTFDIISSLFSIGNTPGWWLQLLSGIAQVILGFLASASYENSVVVLVTYVSIAALSRGIAEIAAAFAIRAVTTTP